MLVLSRKLDQKIQLGQDITITVVRLKGQTVQLGIDAPEGVLILRGELTPRQPAAAQPVR